MDNDLLDKEIWVENRIEEARHEIEENINKKIKGLNYEKTIEALNNEIKKLNKALEQFSYDKDRAIELLEEDMNIKISDMQVIKDNIIEEKLSDLLEETATNTNLKDPKFMNQFKRSDKENVSEKVKENLESLVEKLTQKVQELEQNNNFKGNSTNLKKVEQELDKQDKELKKELIDIRKENENKFISQREELDKKIEGSIAELEVNKLAEKYNAIEGKIETLNTSNEEELNKIKKGQEEFITQKMMDEKYNEQIENLKKEFDNQKEELIKRLEETLINLETDEVNEKYDKICKKIIEFDNLNRSRIEIFMKEQKRINKIILSKLGMVDDE